MSCVVRSKTKRVRSFALDTAPQPAIFAPNMNDSLDLYYGVCKPRVFEDSNGKTFAAVCRQPKSGVCPVEYDADNCLTLELKSIV